MSRLVVYASKVKMILISFGGLAFVGLGLFLLFLEESDWIFKTIGIISILFFGWCTLFAIKQIFSKQPALIIDENGITDYSSAIKAGLVEWKDIEDVQFTEYMGQLFLSIYTYDKDLIINRSHGMQKMLYQANTKLIDSQVNIVYKNLKCPVDDLIEHIQYFRQKHLEALNTGE